MTGMEHAIEKATQVLIEHPSIPTYGDGSRDVCPSCPDADVAGPNSPSHAAHQARALADAGLLAPAPLTEQWGTKFKDGHPIPGKDRDYPWWFKGDPPKGVNVHRYVTDWETP